MNKELKAQLRAVIDGEITDTGRVRGILQDAHRTCDLMWKQWTRLTDLKEQALDVFVNGIPSSTEETA